MSISPTGKLSVPSPPPATSSTIFCISGGGASRNMRASRSRDLSTWRNEHPCYLEELADAPSWFGIFESQFVHRKEDLYYLFVCLAHRHYYETFVVVSDDPYRFLPENKITTLFTHAHELIEIDGETYMSSCGIEDPQILNRSGLWICKLGWLAP